MLALFLFDFFLPNSPLLTFSKVKGFRFFSSPKYLSTLAMINDYPIISVICIHVRTHVCAVGCFYEESSGRKGRHKKVKRKREIRHIKHFVFSRLLFVIVK